MIRKTFWIMVCYKDLQNLLPFLPHMLTLDSDSLLCLSILYTLYFTNQNTSSTSIKNSTTDIKCLNIENISKKLPKFSIEQNVLYYYTRKFAESKFNCFGTPLPCAQNKTHGKQNLCRVLYWGTRQRGRSAKRRDWPPSLPCVFF